VKFWREEVVMLRNGRGGDCDYEAEAEGERLKKM
jgi:hypothetical protein